jgi:hypothetical protein
MRRLLVAATTLTFAGLPELDAQGPQVTRYESPHAGGFAVPTSTFFGETGLLGRYLLSGCTNPSFTLVGASACVDVVVERGIEAATGAGALRLSFLRATSNGVGAVQLHGSSNSLLAGDVTTDPALNDGRAFYANYPLYANVGQIGGERTSRNSTAGLFLGTFRPTEGGAYLYFAYHDPRPPERVGPITWPCPWYGQTCVAEGFRAHLTITDITTASTVPEPSTWALLGTGLLTVGGIAARRRKRVDP